jgi:glycosyltransferase involved in cell wall biosynthesis
MSFLIFGDSFSFPEGNAATNRIYTFAKGFTENGMNVHVICFKNEYLDNYNGMVDGIKYYHPYSQTKRSNFFIVRRWVKFLKYIKAFTLVRKINREDKILAVNLYTYNIQTELFVYILGRLLRTKIIFDRCEHPMQLFKTNLFGQTFGKLKTGLQTKLYDGMFCISYYLIDFYKKRGFDEDKLFLVPSTVDTERFSSDFSTRFPYEYIIYCGSLTILKDGVNILVESFKSISDKYPEINLVLIGKGDSIKDEILIKELVAKLDLNTRVVFLGQLPRTEVPAYLCNAKILALARPESKIADAGFPSKLTEYLATGKPVVVTAVGEIPVYLKDSQHAFLAIPGSVDSFSEKLDFALSNYEFAQSVGRKGRELTSTIFNYNFQSKRMIEFIYSLWNNKPGSE